MITISCHHPYHYHVAYDSVVNSQIAKWPRFTSHHADISHRMCVQIKETVMIHLLSIVNELECDRDQLCRCYKVRS